MPNGTSEDSVENLEEMLKSNEIGIVVQAFRARGRINLLCELAPHVKTKGLREALEDVLDGIICKSAIPDDSTEYVEIAPEILFGGVNSEASFFPMMAR